MVGFRRGKFLGSRFFPEHLPFFNFPPDEFGEVLSLVCGCLRFFDELRIFDRD